MKILGLSIVGAGEADRYMRKTMEEFKRLCDNVMIVTCNAGEKEKAMIAEYGFDSYEDNREWGVDQPNIKTDLLTKAGEKYNPDWIIWLDMDEVFATEFTRIDAEQMIESQPDEIAYNFLVVNLYNDEEHFAHDAGIQRFWNIRLYKYLPEFGLQFQRKNVHCGAAPPICYKYGWHAPYYLKHYGLMKKEDRDRRIVRYQQYDPQKKFKAGPYYDDLGKELKMHKFDPEGLLAKLRESKETQKRVTPKLRNE